MARRARVKRKLVPGAALWSLMEKHLRLGLSPAQIESTLPRMPDPVRLSRETIYNALYAMPRGQLRASLLALMRRRHKTKRSQQGKNKINNGSIPDMTLIDSRPVEVQMRLVPGHWEGDLIIGKGNQSQVGTLVERTTLFVALVKLDSGTAEEAAEAFSKILNRFESQMRRSMTYDQGVEMRHHKRLTANAGSMFTSPIRMRPGSGASWKTPTACSVNICPREPTCPCFLRNNWMTSRGCSTRGQGRLWVGEHQPSSFCPRGHSTSCNTGLQFPNSLHLDLESVQGEF